MGNDPLEQEGRSARITRLIVANRCTLFSYIFACVRNHADAEEVLQEVSVAIMTSFDRLNDDAEFLPWAREIARRQVLSFFRRSKRPMVYDSELVDILAFTANEYRSEDIGQRRYQALQDCLEQLPRTSREIMLMRYGDAVSGVDKIAIQIGRSMAATYGLLKRIRINLRDCVEGKMAQGCVRD